MNSVPTPYRSPFFTYYAFRPFRLQPPDGPPLPLYHVTSCSCLFIQRQPAYVSATDYFKASRITSSLAEPPRPNRVRYPTDWPFALCCSPPRIAATQLLRLLKGDVIQEWTCTTLTRYARRRTGAGLRPASAIDPRSAVSVQRQAGGPHHNGCRSVGRREEAQLRGQGHSQVQLGNESRTRPQRDPN
jgi:hypothetical protein